MRYKVLIALIMCYLLFVPTGKTNDLPSDLEEKLDPKMYEYFLKKIIWTLDIQISNISRKEESFYKGILIERSDKLKKALSDNFDYFHSWDFVAYFEDLLLSKIQPNISIDELYTSWSKALDSVEVNLTEIMNKDKRLSYSKQKKTTSKEMLLIVGALSNLQIISPLILCYHGSNQNNYIFLLNERKLFYEIKNWYDVALENLQMPCSRSYTITSKLKKELLTNHISALNTSFLHIKNRMVKNILSKISGEINQESDIRAIIHREIIDIHGELVYADHANRVAIIDLFQDSLPNYIYITLPNFWSMALYNSSLEQHPDKHFQTYLDNINTWFSYHKNTIKNFSNTLKEPNSYLLKRDAFGEHFTNNKDKAAKETLRIIWATLVGIDTPIETSLKNLEIIWMVPLKEDELRATFDQLFEELGERNWLLFQRNFMSLMPTETIIHQAIETAQKK